MRLWHSALYRVLVPDIALTIFNTVLLNITLEEWWSFLFVLNRFVHFPLYIIFVHIPVDTTQICDCFPRGSAGKESICNVENLGSIPGLGKSPGVRERLPTPVFWPGEFHGLNLAKSQTRMINFHSLTHLTVRDS